MFHGGLRVSICTFFFHVGSVEYKNMLALIIKRHDNIKIKQRMYNLWIDLCNRKCTLYSCCCHSIDNLHSTWMQHQLLKLSQAGWLPWKATSVLPLDSYLRMQAKVFQTLPPHFRLLKSDPTSSKLSQYASPFSLTRWWTHLLPLQATAEPDIIANNTYNLCKERVAHQIVRDK